MIRTRRLTIVLMIIITALIGVYASYWMYTEKQFRDKFTNVEMNTSLKFLDPVPEWNTYKIHDGAYLELINVSTESIGFERDKDTLLLFYDLRNLTWREVKNSVNYIELSGKSDGFIEPRQDDKPSTSIWANPDVDPSLKRITLRVVALGKIYQNGIATGKLTGAYIDVTLYK